MYAKKETACYFNLLLGKKIAQQQYVEQSIKFWINVPLWAQ